MVDEFKTDEEQEEALKKWLADYGKSVVTGILLAIAILFGWQGYQNKVQAEAEAASVLFQSLLLAAEQQTDAGKVTMAGYAQQLQNDYPGSLYAAMASLHLAKAAVEQGKLDEALRQLQWVLDHNPDPTIKPMAELRLARVYMAKADYQAMQQLVDASEQPYKGAFVELQADALALQGKTDQAIDAYKSAMDLNEKADQSLNNRNIEMKLQSLGVNLES